MDRRKFLTGSILTTAALGLPKTSLAEATALAPVPMGTSAVAHIDLWWKLADKRGTEEVKSADWRDEANMLRNFRIDELVADRKDSALVALKSMGFVVPKVWRDGGGCTHYPRNDMTQEEKGDLQQSHNKHKWEATNRALHDRFEDHGSCRCDWTNDYPKEFNPNMPGDVRLTMVMTHPNLTMTPEEVLGLLSRQSLGLVDAKMEIVHEVTKVAAMVRTNQALAEGSV